jgi:hypothetical protein
MRPLYETPESLENEQRVADLLEMYWTRKLVKLPIAYQVDFAVVKEDITAWAEIKCRTTEYPEMYLSLHKWMAGKELSRQTGLPFILVYGFKDKVCWKTVEKDNPKIVIGGRQDRQDWQDMEPMAVFKLDQFKTL